MPRGKRRVLALVAVAAICALVPLVGFARLSGSPQGAAAPGSPSGRPPALRDHHLVSHPELDVKGAEVPRQLVLRLRGGTPAGSVGELERRLGVERVEYVPQIGIDAVRLPEGVALAGIQGRLAKERSVLGTGPNHILHVRDYVPNDPDFGSGVATSHDGVQSQWGLARIGAPGAWASFRGPGSVVVAVVDTGLDSTHPDLAGVVLPGYNVLEGNADTFDDHGHGTLVGGVIGAVTDNSVGVAGVSFNSARLLPVKVLDQLGNGSEVGVAAGITYAADHGAQVINLSLGGASYSQAIQDAVRYAWRQGALVVAAAGNGGDGTRQYPAADAWALGVAASDQSDAIARFSSYGDEVSLSAPGVSILSTMPTYPVSMTRNDGYQQGYDAFSGTSSAAPLVSGLAALLLAQQARSPADTVQALERSAHVLSAGWNPSSGYGRLDAAGAIGGAWGQAATGGIRGQVVDSSGSPVGGAVVSAGGASETTSADGTYRLAGLAASGNPYTVSVQSGAGSFQSQPLSVVGGADTFTDIVAAAGPAGAAQAVQNGGFEAGSFKGWTLGGGAPTPTLSTAQVHSGSYAALLGSASGREGAGDSWASQAVHVQLPAGASHATLSFWTWSASSDLASFDWQEAQVRDSSGALLASVVKGAANEMAWKQVSFDLTPYSGRDLQLYFNVHSDGAGDLSWMYLDDVEVSYS